MMTNAARESRDITEAMLTAQEALEAIRSRRAAIHGDILQAAEAGDTDRLLALRTELADLPVKEAMASIRLGKLDIERLEILVEAGARNPDGGLYGGQLKQARERLNGLLDSVATPEGRAIRKAEAKTARDSRLASVQAATAAQMGTRIFGFPYSSEWVDGKQEG